MPTCEYCGADTDERYRLALEWSPEEPDEDDPNPSEDPGAGEVLVCGECADAVAPVAYRGLTTSPASSRRWRRKVLRDLLDAGVLETHETTGGWVWTPSADVVDEAARGAAVPASDQKEATQ